MKPTFYENALLFILSTLNKNDKQQIHWFFLKYFVNHIRVLEAKLMLSSSNRRCAL